MKKSTKYALIGTPVDASGEAIWENPSFGQMFIKDSYDLEDFELPIAQGVQGYENLKLCKVTVIHNAYDSWPTWNGVNEQGLVSNLKYGDKNV